MLCALGPWRTRKSDGVRTGQPIYLRLRPFVFTRSVSQPPLMSWSYATGIDIMEGERTAIHGDVEPSRAEIREGVVDIWNTDLPLGNLDRPGWP